MIRNTSPLIIIVYHVFITMGIRNPSLSIKWTDTLTDCNKPCRRETTPTQSPCSNSLKKKRSFCIILHKHFSTSNINKLILNDGEESDEPNHSEKTMSVLPLNNQTDLDNQGQNKCTLRERMDETVQCCFNTTNEKRGRWSYELFNRPLLLLVYNATVSNKAFIPHREKSEDVVLIYNCIVTNKTGCQWYYLCLPKEMAKNLSLYRTKNQIEMLNFDSSPLVTTSNKNNRNVEDGSSVLHFDRCLMENTTSFLLFRHRSLFSTSTFLKTVLLELSLEHLLSDDVNIFYDKNDMIIVKLLGYNKKRFYNHFPNFSSLLREGEEVIFHSLKNPAVHIEHWNTTNGTYFLTNEKCPNRILINLGKMRFTNSCDVILDNRTVLSSQIAFWVAVTNSDTTEHLYACVTPEKETDWPFTIFILSLICLLIYYFFRTICYKNQGYKRSYHTKSTALFLRKETLLKGPIIQGKQVAHL